MPAPASMPSMAVFGELFACLVLGGVAGCGGDLGAGADAQASAGGRTVAVDPVVRPGLEVLLADSIHLVRGRRVGLVTNHTGINGKGAHGIDLLMDHPDVSLVALYSPEHGIRGDAEAGVRIDSSVDLATGLPVHSLYGTTRKPTPEMLEGIDVLLFDIQDIGTRYYTYIYTMALAMEAAGEKGIPFVVLDRPNPVDGVRVQGNVLDPALASFVGMYPLPMRHGMTPGELARLYQQAFGVAAELVVVPLAGWRREVRFPETGLPWRAPSPNMPDLESALHYPGTCLFEGTNLSVGRGTPQAFQQIGAPWLDGDALAARMTALDLPGVRFHAVTFVPDAPGDGKFGGETVRGVRLEVTDPDRYDPARTGIHLVVEARAVAGEAWAWAASHFDRLAGTDAVRLGVEAGASADTLMAGWAEALAEFMPLREAALLYP
jgi:uncharacterized protein YbbC (DUF1343 family)